MNTVDSKKIYASKKRSNDLLLLLDINIDTVEIVGFTTSLYTFEGPLDFYIDHTDSLPLYNHLGNIILDGNITDLLDVSQVVLYKFPPFTPPIVNYYEKSPKILSYKKNPVVHDIEINTIRVYFTDDVPDNQIYNNLVDENDLILQNFINNLFSPVLKINIIVQLFVQYKKEHKLNIKINRLRSILPMYRYYIVNGPFRKCWIPFRYDPKKDKQNYKYQIIDLRAEGTFFHLFEKDTIIKEVENNLEWYVKDDSDIKNGFFKKTLS